MKAQLKDAGKVDYDKYGKKDVMWTDKSIDKQSGSTINVIHKFLYFHEPIGRWKQSVDTGKVKKW